MTWGKAMPVLIVAGVFDLIRIFFEQFWFFGPALAGWYCTTKLAIYITQILAAAVCGSSATLVGFFGSEAIEAFGAIMAMAVGLLGWLTVGLMILLTNARIFKENSLHVHNHTFRSEYFKHRC